MAKDRKSGTFHRGRGKGKGWINSFLNNAGSRAEKHSVYDEGR